MLKEPEMEEAIKRLKDMLQWSDRLGSDEITVITSIIHDLEELCNGR